MSLMELLKHNQSVAEGVVLRCFKISTAIDQEVGLRLRLKNTAILL